LTAQTLKLPKVELATQADLSAVRPFAEVVDVAVADTSTMLISDQILSLNT